MVCMPTQHTPRYHNDYTHSFVAQENERRRGCLLVFVIIFTTPSVFVVPYMIDDPHAGAIITQLFHI